MWQWVARINIQQISYILQTNMHSPFGLMLLCLGNVSIIYSTVCTSSFFALSAASASSCREMTCYNEKWANLDLEVKEHIDSTEISRFKHLWK